MPTGKQVQGKPLISLTDGKLVGKIQDLYLDETLHKIAAVSLGSEGLIHRKSMVVPRSAVQLMGIDAWLVRDSNVVVAPEDIPDAGIPLAVGALRGREIVTEGGTKIGAVDDIIFDTGGDVLGFGLTRLAVQGPLAERKTIGRSAVSTIGGDKSAMTANMQQAEATEVKAS
jgi:uncharacterized protein YrrD